ncbi:MAG TPA: NAD(+) diphosphatase [Nocardioides sp.]|uniref:NAD(+) diphosphatase n=1 Tax=uncultured Nocardioides sp. TaxID=198441 RepID=UPI000EC6CCBF|nr:NAD(+) diphosphatase [uncultured Nocardioides sp.]HCB04698.1 NAD(+) diphosphatase [Nocardioides sp.]HRD62436.1 NAD(+) diphosphatase [Nocardioides sp.]HRI96622.1 NAD(+) diphosphatase [Nocardioides sp.]HRK46633.1 NAD(+) diphosphatase [Nocardioides sp.]
MDYPHERMAAGAHDRVAVRRRDDAWLEERWADPETRVLVVSGTRVQPRDGAIPWVGPQEAPDGVRVLLGEHDDRAWFAVITGPEQARAAREDWVPLRGLLPHLADDTLASAPLVFHALGLAEWLFVTRFCPRCGEPLAPRSSGHELACANDHVQFPRTDPAVIMVVAAGEPGSEDERCLLGRQAIWPEGRFSTLAGFCEPGETLEDAVRREVLEETGVVVGEVTYFGNQPWPLPASLMLGFVGRAVSEDITVDNDELDDARWFTRAEMKAEAAAGTLVLPGGVSISRSLVEHWYGGPLPGQW